jgi:hypothetical protein
MRPSRQPGPVRVNATAASTEPEWECGPSRRCGGRRRHAASSVTSGVAAAAAAAAAARRRLTDPTALNHVAQATSDDGSCIAAVSGCLVPTSSLYNSRAGGYICLEGCGLMEGRRAHKKQRPLEAGS